MRYTGQMGGLWFLLPIKLCHNIYFFLSALKAFKLFICVSIALSVVVAWLLSKGAHTTYEIAILY